MTPIIPTWIIYAIFVLDKLSIFCIILSIILVIAALCFFMFGYCDTYSDESLSIWIKRIKLALIGCFITAFLAILIPSKEVMYFMLANQFITVDNINMVGTGIKECIDYIFVKIGELK